MLDEGVDCWGISPPSSVVGERTVGEWRAPSTTNHLGHVQSKKGTVWNENRDLDFLWETNLIYCQLPDQENFFNIFKEMISRAVAVGGILLKRTKLV